MSGSERFSEDTLKNLYDEIALLKKRVKNLENRLTGGSGHALETSKQVKGIDSVGETGVSGNWSEGAVANVMSKGAAVSMILLAALILRVITDNGVVKMGTGVLLGVGYAILLGVSGFLLYRRKSPLAAIFSTSGILLLLAVILEAHSAFNAIPNAQAYALMAAAAAGMTITSLIYSVPLPACVGIVSVLVAGVSMDFPKPDFAVHSVFLAVVNIMAFSFASMQRRKCRWLRIVTFVITAGVFLIWGSDLSLRINTDVATPLDVRWFFIVSGFFTLFYTAASILSVWRDRPGDDGIFINILPTGAGVLFYTTSLMVVNASGIGHSTLGLAGVGVATGLLGIAALRAKGPITPPKGINTFAFPAASLLAFSFRDFSGKSVMALAILSWAALCLAWFSTKWSSEGVRVTSYCLQVVVLGASSLLLIWTPSGKQPAAVILSMVFTGVVAFLHYLLVKSHPPTGHTAYYSQFDRKDTSRIMPLIVSVGTVFLAARAVLFTVIGGHGHAYQAGETVLISSGAILLFGAAWTCKNTELKWVGVCMTALGGAKVFLHDLIQIKGIPAVLGLLLFGLAAAVGSLVLGKWPKPVVPVTSTPGTAE